MSNDGTARALTIAGIVVCCLNFILSWFSPFSIVMVLLFGVVLPVVGYAQIRPQSKGSAAGLLIASGIVDIILVSIIGGVLILVAGALVSAWKPFGTESYGKASLASGIPPSSVATEPTGAPAKSVTPKGAKYCVACGAELQGDERFCPVCGATIG